MECDRWEPQTPGHPVTELITVLQHRGQAPGGRGSPLRPGDGGGGRQPRGLRRPQAGGLHDQVWQRDQGEQEYSLVFTVHNICYRITSRA